MKVWNPIETAPKDRAILVCGGTWTSDDGYGDEYALDRPKIARWLDHKDGWHVGNGYAHDVEHWAAPTHWAELPAWPIEV